MSIKISELPSASSVGNNDVIPIVQNGTTKKATANLVKTTISSTINSSSTNDTAAGSEAVYDYSAPKSHATSSTTYGVGTSSNYGHCKTINNLTSASYTAGYALSAYQGKVLNDAKEAVANKTNTIDENSTSTQYPNAQATYQALESLNSQLSSQIVELQVENQQLKSQIPTYTATGTTINVKDSSNLPIADFALLGNSYQATTSIAGGDEYDSPSPDYPQDIHVVTGDNTLNVVGKNLFKGFSFSKTNNQVAFTYNTDGTITANGTASSNAYSMISSEATPYLFKIKSGTYTLSGGIENASIQLLTSSGTLLITTGGASSATQIISEDQEAFLRVTVGNGKQVNNVVLYPQLELNSTATTYEPYQAQTQLISLGDIELARIPDTNIRDRVYKYNGKWYKQGNIKEYNLGDLNWNVDGTGTANYFYRATVARYLSGTQAFALCTHFQRVNITTTDTNIGWTLINNTTIRIRNTTEQTPTDFATWLTQGNAKIYYVLETPTTTEITDTTLIQQLENVLAMNTYKNETNAFSIVASGNEEGELQIEYYQDIATLINDLRAAILSSGNNI